MTLATGQNNSGKTSTKSGVKKKSAFTLIEIVLALMILSLILAASLPSMTSYLTEQRIRNVQHQMERAVQKTRHLAMTSQNVHRLHFTEKGFEIYDATIPENQKPEPILAETWSSGGLVREKIPETPPQYVIPEDWIFSPSGLCDPLRFRISYQQSWMEFSFHPLNAAMQDIEFRMED